MIFVREWRTEQRHNTIAHHLVDCSLVPMHGLHHVLDNRIETALLYWASQWAGAVFVPLSWRLSEDELAYCLADCGARVVVRDGDALPDGDEHSGALDRDERGISLILYTSGTTGRPKGVPRSHAADRAGGSGLRGS